MVICGGIGGPAMEGLLRQGILVIPGVQGDIDVAVGSFLDGSLTADNAPTCDHHNHEDEEGCGCHCGGHCCH